MAGNYNYRNYRGWMYRRIDETTRNISAEFVDGVEEFMTFVNNQPTTQSNGGMFYCPCSSCKNNKFLRGRKIVHHLYSKGFMEEYYVWYMHGEEIDLNVGSSSHQNRMHTRRLSEEQVGNVEDHRYVDMVNDAFPAQNTEFDNLYPHSLGQDFQGNLHNTEQPNSEAQNFYAMLDAANNPLYDGCREGLSQLSLAARLMHNKTDFNLSERCMDSWSELFTEYLPEGNQATGSYYETEKLMRNLGLPYHAIDVCMHN